jgi:hypothetical protein
MTSEFSTSDNRRLAGKARVVKLEDRTRRETKEYPAPDAAARLEVGASKRKASRPSHRDVPVIQIRAGALSEIATQSEKALLESGVQLYQRGAALVRPIVDEVEAAHGTRTKVAQLARVDVVYLRDLLGRVAEFQKFDGRSKAWMPTNPPFEIASTILARLGEWKFPVVAGVLSTPTMRPDGTILDRAGYDAATQLLLIEPPARTRRKPRSGSAPRC